MDGRLHIFGPEVSGIRMPQRLNDPFDYVPHELCKAAAAEVMRTIEAHGEWKAELSAGKMLGVLVVRDENRQTGFLAAFSGSTSTLNNQQYFVPPICDAARNDPFFRREEREISALTERAKALASSPETLSAIENLEKIRANARCALEAMRERMRKAKAERDRLREEYTSPQETERLRDESRREKTAYRREKARWQAEEAAAQSRAEACKAETESLKAERKRRSEELQMMLFDRFKVADAHGCMRSLLEIFAPTPQRVPPSGTGECAAPKLLHYAFTHGMTPLAVAEFWYGASPAGEVRRHGAYYPACRGKCKPLLDYMLRATPTESREKAGYDLPQVIFADEWLAVVEKPAGMLSVAGKTGGISVEEWARGRFAGAESPRAVHRLDMDVSGLMLIAMNGGSYRALQEQFARRTVLKRYIALLDGEVSPDEGVIELPLRPDPLDRPRQTADRLHGKKATTKYRIIMRDAGRSLALLEPVTGRTHQLRVHCAAAEGLNTPIAGDLLYGAAPWQRLALHSTAIEFTHPLTGKRLHFESPCPQISAAISSSGLRGRSETEFSEA